MPLLNVIFKTEKDFLEAEGFFENKSAYTHIDTMKEFNTLSFAVADEADADSLEFYLADELQGETTLQGYRFEYEM
jgi:hypothetical protein